LINLNGLNSKLKKSKYIQLWIDIQNIFLSILNY
jgi:hypothetical protein